MNLAAGFSIRNRPGEMMTKHRWILYSLALIALITVAVFRSATGPDPGPPPHVESKLPREGANREQLNDPGKLNLERVEFDGDDPRRSEYTYLDIGSILTARCYTCHAKVDKVGEKLHFYDYDSTQKLLKPGDLNSPLPRSVAVKGSMRAYVDQDEANMIRQWVLSGAKP